MLSWAEMNCGLRMVENHTKHLAVLTHNSSPPHPHLTQRSTFFYFLIFTINGVFRDALAAHWVDFGSPR